MAKIEAGPSYWTISPPYRQPQANRAAAWKAIKAQLGKTRNRFETQQIAQEIADRVSAATGVKLEVGQAFDLYF